MLKECWVAGVLLLLYLALLAICALLPGGSLLDHLRWLDSGICAQIPTHMLTVGVGQLPLCARNTGMYLGFMLTMITLHLRKKGGAQKLPPRPILAVLVGGIAIMALDGTNSFLLDLGMPHLYQPHNLLRLATGLLAGSALAALVLPMLNQQCWKQCNQQPTIATGKELLWFLPALLISFLGIATQNALSFYPIALLSTAGLITALGIFNLMVIILLSKKDETFSQYHQLFPFMSLGFILAIGELLVLAELKMVILSALGV